MRIIMDQNGRFPCVFARDEESLRSLIQTGRDDETYSSLIAKIFLNPFGGPVTELTITAGGQKSTFTKED